MRRLNYLFLWCFISACTADLDVQKKEKFVNGFVDYLNNLPNQPYTYEEGVFINAQKTDENSYSIDINVKASDLHNVDSSKILRCSGTVQDLQENGVTFTNDHQCREFTSGAEDAGHEEVVTESSSTTEAPEHQPIQLDNEVQTNTAATSGEQFIAVPREQPGAPCIGCATHINPQAAGVADLANLAVAHVDKHEPNAKHTLDNVIDVERQVQVVGGVRYILTLAVNYDSCATDASESCKFNKVCKISVLEKPWKRLPDGSKYRAILANNCTEQWLFDENGEIITNAPSKNNENNDVIVNPNKDHNEPGDEVVKVVHAVDVQAQPNNERTLTDAEVKNIEEQIIPYDQVLQESTTTSVNILDKSDTSNIDSQNVFKVEAAKHYSENSAKQYDYKNKFSTSNTLPDNKKKAIDELINFFNYAGFSSKLENERDIPRMKRSYADDLQVMGIAEKYQKLKRNIDNAKFVYKLAQVMVDNLNEMDAEIKTRVLKDVINAEDEFDNHQHFFYIQARIVIPCEKAECENKDTITKICNGVIDISNEQSPEILHNFCYNEEKKVKHLSKVEQVPVDDPVLQNLVRHALKKIELESSYENALQIQKIIDANTQRVSGTLTRFSLMVAYTNCNKTTPLFKRVNCTILANLGSSLCEVEIHERHWLKERKITYTCTERPIDGTFSNDKYVDSAKHAKDPKVLEMVQEALQYLEVESSRNNKQRLVEIKSVSTQLIAGLMTKLEFVVGYTTCTNDVEVDINSCKMLENEPLRKCQAQIWDRPWLEDGRQMNVSCDDFSKNVESNEIPNLRKKRSTDINDASKVQNKEFPGAPGEQDPTEPKYKQLALNSLKKYVETSGVAQPHQLVSVDKVTIQVVAGTLTKIDFKISPCDAVKCESNEECGTSTSGSYCQVAPEAAVYNCHSEIWTKLWMNFTNIDVTCDINDESKVHREKRQTGVPKEQDPTKTEYQQLAKESLKKYLETSGITKPHQLVSVDKVTTQVVAGSLIKIDFRVSPCSSPYGSSASDSNCQVAVDADVYNCHSEIWKRPWLKSKEITVTCEINNEIPNLRKRRSIDINDEPQGREITMTGGLTEQDPTDPKYQQLAKDSLQKYVETSGISKPHQLVSVEKVTTQVVAGSLTRIDFKVSPCSSPEGSEISSPSGSNCQVTPDAAVYNCHSEIWEKPWMNFTNIDVTCKIKDEPQVHREKRQTITGGQTEQNPNDPKYQQLAQESLKKYLETSGTSKPHQLVSVDKVTTQVVAGSLTRINFKVSPCSSFEGSEGSFASDTNCQVAPDAVVYNCHSEVWEKPWMNFTNIDVTCEIKDEPQVHREKRQTITGGLTEQDPTDPKYQQLAQESLNKYVETSGISKPHLLVSVDKVTTQVVAGKLTRIDFKISPVNNAHAEIFNCHSEILEQAWINVRNISVSCERSNSRGKREILHVNTNNRNIEMVHKSHAGGRQESQDANKIEYKLLAEESLRKYQQLKKSAYYHMVLEVKNVVTKVVSGMIYNIDFTAAPTNCEVNKRNKSNCKQGDVVLYCHAEVWSRPWMKWKDIDVSCNDDTSDELDESIDDDKNKRRRSVILGAPVNKDVNDVKYKLLAQEAVQKYLTKTNDKYVHRVVTIHSVTDQIVEGTKTKIEYSISPTMCLISEVQSSNVDDCELQSPLKTFRCTAEIWDRPWIQGAKDITVNCNKQKSKNIKKLNSKNFGLREKRQVHPDDDYVDEDTKYYYADRAIQDINEHSDSQNLYKLITIHAVQNSIHMGVPMVRMYLETAQTFCLRHVDDNNLYDCEELDGMNHRICLARLWPSPDDHLIVQQISVVCDDSPDFVSVTGISIQDLLKESLKELEKSPDVKYKLVHDGEPDIVPTLDYNYPIKVRFIVAPTNCTKDVILEKNRHRCFVDPVISGKECRSAVYVEPNTKTITKVYAMCKRNEYRKRRSISLDPSNATADDILIQKLVQQSLEKLEMASLNKYKQRVLQINSYSTKLVAGKVTTIDFDVGYTSCLKYEWVDNITSCEFLEHLPRRHCISNVWERLWLNNGRNIEVNCEDDETPLEAHIEFESADTAMQLANEALKHIEAKYPHPRKQKVVRIFSLDKQIVAGIHYRMKLEVGFTDCMALSIKDDCKVVSNMGVNRFCRVNVWLRPWTDHPPNYRVSCDYQENNVGDLYEHMQAEHLFFDFLTTYKPEYINDHNEMLRRFDIFKENVKKIHELNIYERGTAKYAVTKFADLTSEEFSKKYLGLKPSLREPNNIPMRDADIPNVKLPESFDWRDYDAVTEVKDQGSCGSCWAFSVTGNIEGQWKMQSGQLVSLSEQELVDCDKLDEGCNGGLPDNAYRAIEQLGGLELESDYPYEGEDDKCVFNKTLAKVQISGAVNISSNETDMAKWLVQNGPISIGINANAMQFYVGGISHPWKMLCSPKNLDHGVLIVGFGVKDYPLFHKRLPYWVIKNSWGKSWGEQGYYRVYRGDGTCGVNQMASSAVI